MRLYHALTDKLLRGRVHARPPSLFRRPRVHEWPRHRNSQIARCMISQPLAEDRASSRQTSMSGRRRGAR
eukprot:9501018-Pyramimonas_sp.AAC.1